MYTEEKNRSAYLVSNNQKIAFEPIDASKYALQIRFYNGVGFNDGAEFSKMVIPIDKKRVEIGPCKLISTPNTDGVSNQLILLEDLYDLEMLFYKKKLVKLQNNFVNLPLIIGHKVKIRQEFKEYTADLTYDLNVYKNIFDRMDLQYGGETEAVRNSIQKRIIENEGRRFMRFLDDKLGDLESQVKKFSKEEYEYHGFYFRKQIWNFIVTAPFMFRTNNKPRGYSGDSEMMRMVYANDYEGETTFSKLLHKHPVEHPAAQADRNRRTFISNMLRNYRNDPSFNAHLPIKVLSVACGPAFEMNDTIISVEDAKLFQFTLLDQDQSALAEAKHVVNSLEEKLQVNIAAEYLNGSVRTMLNTPQLKSKWGQFDFIYSMGLFDYLTPPVARAILSKLYQLLEPGGKMIIGNFHKNNPSQTYMEYWLDWVLYYRTEDEFKGLVNWPCAGRSVTYDDTGVQMFLQIENN